MRYPEFLADGGSIGFAAPSFGCNIEPYKSAFENALKNFEKMGHWSVLGPNVYEGKGTGISNTPELCGQELTDMYCSDETDVLISCGGGELMCETMEHVDFERIRAAKPKWFEGYSDNTNFGFLLTTMCDTASIYGPCAPAFGMREWHPAIQDAYELLRGQKLEETGYPKYEKDSLKDEQHPLEPYNVTEPRVIRLFNPSEDGKRLNPAGWTDETGFSGRLIGGCMDCLVNLLGTEYDYVKEFNAQYAQDGIIWFLESCDLNVFAIRRAIWQMKHAGWFQNVRGFLIGRPYCNGQTMMGLDQYRAVTELLAEYEVPVLMDLDIGHIAPQMPLINGAVADVSLKGQELNIGFRLE